MSKTKIRGSSLLEAITAMAIVAVVLGLGFTLYAKVVQSQKAVLKVRARAEVTNREVVYFRTISIEEKSEFLNVDSKKDLYAGSTELNKNDVFISDKTGKSIVQSSFLTPVRK